MQWRIVVVVFGGSFLQGVCVSVCVLATEVHNGGSQDARRAGGFLINNADALVLVTQLYKRGATSTVINCD